MTHTKASHNSWTFAKPLQWWLRPFAFMARCQSKTIREQYNLGVRYFDLHVRTLPLETFDPFPVHGIIAYKADLYADLAFLDDRKDCQVRVLLDLRTISSIHYAAQRILFDGWLYKITHSFPNITFLSGRDMPDWKKIHRLPDDDLPEYHASKAKKRLWSLWPWLYATTHRTAIQKAIESAEKPILVDFIEQV